MSGAARNDRARHFLLTNFNVRLPAAPGAARRVPAPTPDWLEERFALFDRFCLPSVAAQSRRDFEWLVRYEPPPHPRHAARLESYRDVPGLRLVPAALSFRRAVRACLRPGDAVVITTRLDNDDALHRDAIACIRRAAAETPPDRAREFLDLPVGYVVDLAQRRVHLCHDPSNHFLSLVERVVARDVRTARLVAHRDAARTAPLRAIAEAPMWIEVVHGRNQRNRTRGAPVAGVDLAAGFDVRFP